MIKENYLWIAAKGESKCIGCGFIKKVEASSLRCKSCYEIAVNTYNN